MNLLPCPLKSKIILTASFHTHLFPGSIAVAFSLPIEIDFIANQPFFYTIANSNDWLPLFSGRVADF